MEPFTPPFCPRASCRHHQAGSIPYASFCAWGSYPTRAFGLVPRFRCLACGATFSSQTFAVDYYAKRVFDYEEIARMLSNCESLSAIGRAYAASTDTIMNRVTRASRQVLAFESELASTRHPSEDLAADGFESFCRSQFHPNNITILVGAKSQFVYAADHATLRRKGRMTEGQRERRAELEKEWLPDPKGIERSFARVAMEGLRVLSDGGRPSITLWTDEHKSYGRAMASSVCLASLREAGRLDHRTICSRVERTRTNPLFPVNYLDREIRKDLHEHVRETVCHGRNVNRQMERFTLYAWWHNYRKPHRVRERVARSHAEVAGYDLTHIARAGQKVWKRRAMLSITELAEPGFDTWLRSRASPGLSGPDYLPGYAMA